MKARFARLILFAVIAAIAMTGCAGGSYSRTSSDAVPVFRVPTETAKSPYSEPYKYVWTAPVVQEVVVPGAIRGGVFYPAHKETVIVRPSDTTLIPAGEGK